MADPTATMNPFLQAILDSPAGPPPPGVTPNFVDPPDIGGSVLSLAIALVIITAIVLAIRIFTKLYLIRTWNIEDYLIIPAWALQVFVTVEILFSARSGLGTDMWNLRLSRYLSALHYLDNIDITYAVSVGLIKVAILAQLLRIFVPHRKANMKLWLVIHFTIVVIVVFYTILTGFTIWRCNPREKAWNPLLPGSCFHSTWIYQTTGIFNIISGFAIFIIPIWPVWKLQLPRGKKIAIIALFATGLFDCITSLVRTYISWSIIDSPNFSYDITIVGCWTSVETGLGIMICCLPVTPRFVRFLRLHIRFTPYPSINEPSLEVKRPENKHTDAYPFSPLGAIDHDQEKTGKHIIVETCFSTSST